ncbi:MAG: hypothetical protein ACPHLL_08005, partial [Porticoccaceae bacterium]
MGRQLYALSLITLVSTTVSAGELVLVNGDLIKGDLVEQASDHIIWASENFGHLSVDLDNVATVNGLS